MPGMTHEHVGESMEYVHEPLQIVPPSSEFQSAGCSGSGDAYLGNGGVNRLDFEVSPSKWPIVFHPNEYDITFWGLQRFHSFDSTKWGRIHNFLIKKNVIGDDDHVEPKQATEKELRMCHTQEYLDSLLQSSVVAQVTEMPLFWAVTNDILQTRLLQKLRYQTGGTVLAGKLALERQWAINLGGGFHHCSSDRGGGFCAYADITLALTYLFNLIEKPINKAMIVDLDAHQGNGHERDFLGNENVYIMDVYNAFIYPLDREAKRAIRRPVELRPGTGTERYLTLVDRHLKAALDEFCPDVIAYNAGTDILIGDPLGGLSVSREGVIRRDELVFQEAFKRQIPIFMLTSGGYQASTAEVVADSIANLVQKGWIKGPEPGYATQPSVNNEQPHDFLDSCNIN